MYATCLTYKTDNYNYNKRNIAFLINDINYNLILAGIFILNINISVIYN